MAKPRIDSGGVAHAEFGASNASRWLNCPGSVVLCRSAPEVPESDYAAEGTRAHACLEFLLKNRRQGIKAQRAALKQWPRDMVEHCVGAAEWILTRYAAAGNDADLLCETRVDASSFTCTGQFGTTDAAVIEEFGTLVVVDFKYGAGIVRDPEGDDGNGDPQLVYYALALSHQYHHNFSAVELVVIQPRAYHESGETTRTVTMPMADLLAWAPRFREGVLAAGDPNAPLKAGKWCRFCAAAPSCPAIRDEAMAEAQIVFADGAIEAMPEPRMVRIPDLGTMLHACDKLEVWIKRVREHAAHVLEKGGEVDGWKLVERRGTRKWRNPEAATVDARERFGARAFSEPELVSPAQLEKLVGKKAVANWLAPRVTNESSGTVLTPASDKREEVKPLSKVFQ